MDEEIDQVARYLNLKRSVLASAFVEACRAKPSTSWEDIDAAVEASKELDTFDYYTDKYLGYVYDNNRYCFRRKIEKL